MAGALPEEALLKLIGRVVKEVRSFTEGQISHIYELVKIGLGLSSEKRIDRLLEMIVSEARRFTHADGGTLYITSEDGESLDFAIVQNDSLGVFMGGSGERISWPSVPMRLADGRQNHGNVSAYCALTGESVNIHDVYSAAGFDFQGTKDFDESTGYRSQSMLVIPLRDHEEEVIGVLQLLNAREKETGKVVSFPEEEVEMVTSLASEAAIALTNMRLVKGLENLLDAFVRTIGDAIDEKSPYTAGHIYRVSKLTSKLAQEVNRAGQGIFAEVFFDEAELAEISMAAWLHDVGKITTPEFVMDKATKLETVLDRLELVRLRVEIIKRDKIIARLSGSSSPDSEMLPDNEDEWSEILGFLAQVNLGSEGLSDQAVDRLKGLARHSYGVRGRSHPLLTADEVENLCVRCGTLTEEERQVVNHHAEMTIRMLEQLPFPKKLRNVPAYAGMHHEKLAGSGYPRGLRAEQIPLPSRMIALADILDALTAVDRPYKAGKLLSESLAILEKMVEQEELDGDLCDLAIESGVIVQYAWETLPAELVDDFIWRGKVYSVSGGQGSRGMEVK
ncbi:MAG TPA: GAF domain-containing protein [Deltaproteobacteria bacterium]|nr:GAF domain-containing protein [Deltaproteobacteria bacterium]